MTETIVIKRIDFTPPTEPFMVNFYGVPMGAGSSVPFDDTPPVSKVDVLRLLMKNPETTDIVIVSGDSMEGHNIFSGDMLFVDRSVEPKLGHVVIVNYEGVEYVKVWETFEGKEVFASRNGKYHPMPVNENTKCTIRGVVVRVIHDL